MTDAERLQRALASLSSLERNVRERFRGYVHEPEVYRTYNQVLEHLSAVGFDTAEYTLPHEPIGNMGASELLIKIDAILGYFELPPPEERKIGFVGPRK